MLLSEKRNGKFLYIVLWNAELLDFTNNNGKVFVLKVQKYEV